MKEEIIMTISRWFIVGIVSGLLIILLGILAWAMFDASIKTMISGVTVGIVLGLILMFIGAVRTARNIRKTVQEVAQIKLRRE
jgi:uncharacterized YccA/Bax inhibitor family protein